MPKVSVIVPIYGVEKYLRECLDSIINQTLKDIEIICIDDGSKDNCPAIIDEYAQKDKRIIAIHKLNGGYGHSCNAGLDIANGEYIAIVEPDDFIDKNMFLNLHDAALRNNADIVKSNYIENYNLNNGSFQKIMPDNKEFVKPRSVFTLREFPAFMLIHPSVWSCLYKKEFLDKNKIRFIEAKGAGWTDNPFQVMTMNLAQRIFYVDKAYYYWRKLNLDDANDLKDITVPFLRISEIHKWLKEQNINDSGILSFLYKRELVYFHIINRIITKDRISDYFALLKDYAGTVDISVIKSSRILKPRDKRFFFLLSRFPLLAVILDKFRVLKHNLLKFRFGKKERYIRVCGKIPKLTNFGDFSKTT
ncbi:MAG: glycosyltransferase [Candidatus Gastranaerophilales bacterium]|nr:glycosyltransferase [Candidatus Gastranaerophilales bacterium]